MKKILTKLNTCLLIAGVSTISANAATTLVDYDINGKESVTKIQGAGLMATDLTSELGSIGGTKNGGWFLDGSNFSSHDTDGGNLDASNNTDEIFTFSITADPGSTLSVDKIEWTVGLNSLNTNAAYHYSLFKVSDQSDFSTILAQSGNLAQTTAEGYFRSTVGYTEKTFNLDSLGLSGYQTLYFAIESSTRAGGAQHDPVYKNFSVEGDVVPEPSSTALLGLGGLALILRRRR